MRFNQPVSNYRSTLTRVLAVLLLMCGVLPGRAEPAFQAWLQELKTEAVAFGIAATTFDLAFKGVEPDVTLPDLALPGKTTESRGQAEFVRHPRDYLDAKQLSGLAEKGKALARQHVSTLASIERSIGLDRNVVLAIWGRETAYGQHKSPHYAIRVLATQAYLGRRKDLFRKELLHALRLLQDGHRTVETLKSSWAGAMGLTQFMPSEFYVHAVDLDQDGRIDIWSSVPDALGSAARQLKDKGWIAGQAWGYEVRLPDKVDCAFEGPAAARPLGEWQRLGVERVGGRSWTDGQKLISAYLMMPIGPYGPAFLVTENFLVIKRYNMSDLYAAFVGNLSDRIGGGGGFETPWQDVAMPATRMIEELQERLQAAGRPIEKIDGKMGSNTRREIGLYQRANGLKVDCWPGAGVLQHIRGSSGEARRG